MKIGLEIHQQLNTHKLFCNCPSIITNEKPSVVVKRKLKATMSELNEYDIAALAEEMRKREFIYFGYNTTCLVELDEEPPHEMNEEALKMAIQIADLLHMKLVDEIQVMRKIVLDGSNTTGFQRTSLIARNGYIDTSKGKVRIDTLCLEEDSARKLKEEGNKVFYSLDRLGIPLIEISTAPDIKSPEHAKEVAEKIGLYLRMTNVKRGIGTIRQDINVSVKGGKRTEIKGFQELSEIPEVIKNEVKRQENMIKLSKKIKNVNFDTKLLNVTKLNWKSKTIKNAISRGQEIFAFKVPKFKGLFKWEAQPGKRLARDLVEYLKFFTGIKGFMHSDEIESKELREKLGCKKEDGYIVIFGDEDIAKEAKEILTKRLNEYKNPISEVRGVEETKTKFLRPMPGKARMYPETDIPPIKTKHIKFEKLEHPEEKIKKYMSMGLSKEQANQIIWNDYKLFESGLKLKVKPTLLASIVLSYKDELKRLNAIPDKTKLIEGLELLGKRYITKEVFYDVVARAIKDNENVKNIIKKLKLKRISKKELDEIIEKMLSENKELRDFDILMGLIMRKVRGRIEGKIVAEELKRYLKNEEKRN